MYFDANKLLGKLSPSHTSLQLLLVGSGSFENSSGSLASLGAGVVLQFIW